MRKGNWKMKCIKCLAAILHRAYDKAYDEMVNFKAKEKEVKTVVTQQEGSLDGMNDLHSQLMVDQEGVRKKGWVLLWKNKWQVHPTRKGKLCLRLMLRIQGSLIEDHCARFLV
ncbi:hypothetical protein PIB30_008858 [Stylosanthes scabra]|uniref:Uncharacterized protein n=1 Tax=Stylosanthes scabra TaxID=79078 RepID=A0ABU6Z6Y5_9FABA|nr:hypothetical protein [Stylosanthes scabra]